MDCLKKLNGMFAFCICDLRGGVPQLFLARDHFGIKPLYYVHRGRRLAFASEAKALLQLPGMGAAVEPEALHQYLTFLWVPGRETMFREVLAATESAKVAKTPARHSFSARAVYSLPAAFADQLKLNAPTWTPAPSLLQNVFLPPEMAPAHSTRSRSSARSYDSINSPRPSA